MRYFFPIFCICMLACSPKNESEKESTVVSEENALDRNEVEAKALEKAELEAKDKAFYVGTYTDGESQGIYRYSISAEGNFKRIGLVAMSDNPSFLAKSLDGKYLLSVREVNSEAGNGVVDSYLITGDSLQFISSASSGGAHPCHVSVDFNGYVLAANYTGGNVGFLKLDSVGKLSGLLDVQQHTGRGSNKRQDAPHAHSVWFVPHSDEIISVDLGTNELWFSSIDPILNEFRPSDPPKMKMPEGAGPRHLTFHKNGKWIYVLNELACTVALIEEDMSGNRLLKSSISTLPKDWKGENTCADIHISADGQFVYASNRGHNSIAIYSVDQTNGKLSLVGHESVNGDSPRNFSLTPGDQFLVVANQKTNNLVSFKRDAQTGLLTFIDEIDAPTPVCIVF